MKGKKIHSLKWKLISVMLLYWVLPFLVIIATMGLYMLSRQEKNQLERLVIQAELNAETSAERLGGVITDSRQATYDRVLYEKYKAHKCAGEVGERIFHNAALSYLDSQFAHKKNSVFTVLLLKEEPYNQKYYTCYNYRTGGSYQMIQDFFNEDSEKIQEVAETLGTAVRFVKCGDGLYLVRNMVDRSFEAWSILVTRVNMDYCFETLTTSWEEFASCVQIDGKEILSTGREQADWDKIKDVEIRKKGGYALRKSDIYVYSGAEENDFDLKFLLQTTQKKLFTPLYGYLYVVLTMVLFLIPMLLLFLWLSRKYLSRPVKEMMECAENIEKGDLGYQLNTSTGSLEFEYLRESMNRMSSQLKYQFDHIYEEELALRDAKIMALQSHINPHFMNNTLEIINWEARLSGNDKVSRMIEALSTLLDAAIDRKRLPEVRLSEEMVYVKAYFYITSQRLGRRLEVINHLPEEMMGLMVPRLIMQPIIENAIEHGIVPRGGGRVWLEGERDGDYLYLKIINDGEFTKEDAGKVARLLAPDYDTSKESSGNLGIANVNQRLRILYGENCGLTIQEYEEDKTISVLTILVGAC